MDDDNGGGPDDRAFHLLETLLGLGMERPSPFNQLYLRALLALMEQTHTNVLTFSPEELDIPDKGLAVAVHLGQVLLQRIDNYTGKQGTMLFPRSGPGSNKPH